jgi:hypothetical protein
MNLLEWLDSDSKKVRRNGTCPTNLEYLSELISVNGGSMELEIGMLGKIMHGEGPYGRVGLTLTEGLELIHLVSVVKGFMLACDENPILWKAFEIKIQQEINRVLAGGDSGTGGCIEIVTVDQLNHVLKQKKMLK